MDLHKQIKRAINYKDYCMKFYKKIKTLASVLVLLGCINSYGQQDPHFTQYMYNTMSVNPGYTGSTDGLTLTALGRVQWVDIDGAPRTQTFSAHSPVGYSGLGVGVNFTNDELGPSNEFFFDGNVSYTVRLSEVANFAIGLRLGGRSLSVDWSKGNFKDDDPTFASNNIGNKFLPTLGSGLYYYTDKSYLGLSVPNFLETEHYDGNRRSVAKERLHYFIMGGHVFTLNQDIKLKPAFIGKVVTGAPLSFDVSVNALFHDRFTAGLAYRWEDSISGLLGFQITNNFFLGYAYDLTTSNYQNYNSGSHELMLRLNFLRGKRLKSPRFF